MLGGHFELIIVHPVELFNAGIWRADMVLFALKLTAPYQAYKMMMNADEFLKERGLYDSFIKQIIDQIGHLEGLENAQIRPLLG